MDKHTRHAAWIIRRMYRRWEYRSWQRTAARRRDNHDYQGYFDAKAYIWARWKRI